MTAARSTPAPPMCSTPLRDLTSFILRIALGGLFMLSGYMKLGLWSFTIGSVNILPLAPLDFAFSIRAFKFDLSNDLVTFLAFTIPWVELLAGAAVFFGLFTRGGAALISVLMLGFIAGIASLLYRGFTDVTCPCFGSLGLFCGTAPIGYCHIIRNASFFAVAIMIWALGPGFVSLDRLLGGPTCKPSPRA